MRGRVWLSKGSEMANGDVDSYGAKRRLELARAETCHMTTGAALRQEKLVPIRECTYYSPLHHISQIIWNAHRHSYTIQFQSVSLIKSILILQFQSLS